MSESALSFFSSNHDALTAVAAVVALVISSCSIVVTIWNMRMQQAHNRKSVVPIAYVPVGDYEDHTFVRLQNVGVGPMIIGKVTITSENNNAESHPTLIEYMPNLPAGYFWNDFVEDVSDRALSPGDHITLVELYGDMSDRRYRRLRESVRKILADLTVTVEYKNVFEEDLPIYARKLDWFARQI